MPDRRPPPLPAPRTRLVLVTGLSGAGKSSALRVLEDLGYEAVDNLPLSLLTQLLKTPETGETGTPARPLAIGIDTRTRAFSAQAIVDQLKTLRRSPRYEVRLVYLDCGGEELVRRFSETRRRHPMAQDRPVQDGIARERELLEPLRRFADHLFDTTDFSVHQLKGMLSDVFALEQRRGLTVTVMSFGFARGIPRDADLVFDMRFLRNPHWVEGLREHTGQEAVVGAYIEGDPAFAPAFDKMAELVIDLLPNYQREGKSYLTVAFGCTGGKHRSVFSAEKMAYRLETTGWHPNLVHRDLSRQANVSEPVARESITKESGV
jgi:UPF0042 nucleotide-binding protein